MKKVCKSAHCTLWSLQNFCIIVFWKNSVKTVSLVKSLLYNWFHEIFLKWYKNFTNSTLCIVEKRESHCHANIFPSNQFVVKFFSKTLIWRNFCEKTMAWQGNSEISTKLQCFKSRDDNFLSNQPIFQTHFSMLLVNFEFLNSYGWQ